MLLQFVAKFRACWPALLLAGVLAVPATLQAAPRVGEPAPGWTLPGLDGGQARLADYAGKPVLIDFWASWCVPCRLSMPALEAIRADYGARVAVVAISVDTEPQPAREFIERVAPGFPSLIDTAGAVAERYALIGMPSSYILDRDGVVQFIHEGFRKGDDDVWRETIDRLLADTAD